MHNPVTENLIDTLQPLRLPPIDIDFIRAYYGRLSGQDYDATRSQDYCDLALKHRAFAEVRAPNQTLVDIFNVGGNADALSTRAIPARTVIHVITEDQPFLIDSLLIRLNAHHLTPRHTLFPLYVVTRDARGTAVEYQPFQSLQQVEAKDVMGEYFIQFIIEYIPAAQHAQLATDLHKVIADLGDVVGDWQTMRQHTTTYADKLVAKPTETTSAISELAEYGALLHWLADHQFTFLGYCELEVTPTDGRPMTRLVPSSPLGCLATMAKNAPDSPLEMLPPIVLSENAPVVFTKARQKTTIHRQAYPECIILDYDFGRDPSPSSPHRVGCLIGFLSIASLTLPTADIPLLREKTAHILRTSALRRGGYAYNRLRNTLQTLPREKLFHLETADLGTLCMTLLNQERRKTRVHLHRNQCGHYYSCLVYVPRDLFNSELRQRIQDFLARTLSAHEVEFDVYFSPSILTRIHYSIHAEPPAHAQAELPAAARALEAEIQGLARDWNDQLFVEMSATQGVETANRVLELFRNCFGSAYQQDYVIADAVVDIAIFQTLQPEQIYAVLSRSRRPDSNNASFKLYCREHSIALSAALPILENMGVRILGGRPHKILTNDGVLLRILEFEMYRQDGSPFEYGESARKFETTFVQCWYGTVENDGFNQLTLLAGLGWRRVNLIRAYYRYLKQIGLVYSENYIIEVLAKNSTLVVGISDLFDAMFQPHGLRASREPLCDTIEQQLAAVVTLDEEKIIRALLTVVNATLRTNYFQLRRDKVDEVDETDGNGDDPPAKVVSDAAAKPYLSLKLNPSTLPDVPKPVPKFEIFVYSPQIAGVHLRGGAVARGGLRWSERPEDFRTEVLGLVKAQHIKNAVIVPVGSKGGFVVRQWPDTTTEAMQQQVIACYQTFIRGLLDITDNMSGAAVVPPAHVVRLDGDDPYLVVAADKGTATFSDIANDLAVDYGFWLGDAFASGGSAGYDHKKMGITARGAWESIKRHFRELGKDIQTEPFTVVGIGDMAGDVFGNGMLLSPHIKLIAAFNHRHIFIDPNPDPETSFRERQRLFALPRSTWSDYDQTLLSNGGGLYARDAKSLELSEAARDLLGADRARYTPNELINLILRAEVELFWNGGIGTYVKATAESQAEAQDRNNDALRVDAEQLRCKVIGEGGNLGMTQLARIEFSQRGGLCYTDAIDNSAGVDTSDHEVNIKILLNAEVQNNTLAVAERNTMLATMADDVARLVLANNYLQTQILSIESANSHETMPQQIDAIRSLEAKGLLNRELEFLANQGDLKARFESGKYLTRPELAVLLAYSKMDVYQSLLDSELPSNTFLNTEIENYFPALIKNSYPQAVLAHPLRAEIIATQVTNNMVGVMGADFHLGMGELTGSSVAQITSCYIAARTILDTPALIDTIQALDNTVAATVQIQCLTRVAKCLEASIVWLLANTETPLTIAPVVARYRHAFSRLIIESEQLMASLENESYQQDYEQLKQSGVPEEMARTLAAEVTMQHGLDIVEIALVTEHPPTMIAEIYFSVEKSLALNWLHEQIETQVTRNQWHKRAQFSISNELRRHQAELTTDIVTNATGDTARDYLDLWHGRNQTKIDEIHAMVNTLQQESGVDLAMLTVVVSQLNRLL